jgi:hypothetical protein
VKQRNRASDRRLMGGKMGLVFTEASDINQSKGFSIRNVEGFSVYSDNIY